MQWPNRPRVRCPGNGQLAPFSMQHEKKQKLKFSWSFLLDKLNVFRRPADTKVKRTYLFRRNTITPAPIFIVSQAFLNSSKDKLKLSGHHTWWIQLWILPMLQHQTSAKGKLQAMLARLRQRRGHSSHLRGNKLMVGLELQVVLLEFNILTIPYRTPTLILVALFGEHAVMRFGPTLLTSS